MWHKDFADRLDSWAELRNQNRELPLDEALKNINDYWQKSPWQPYYLHWDDQPNWPDPWQLLSDNLFCDLARGLGILYTVSMLEHKDLVSYELILAEDDRNLVLVNKLKYTLNWDGSVLVNTPLVGKVKKRFINPTI